MRAEREMISGLMAKRFPLFALIAGLLCMSLGVVFAALGGHGSHDFFSSYLVSFSYFLSISLGAMFFVLIQFLTKAGWSVVVRRLWELMMSNIVLMSLLILPILLGMQDIYHHWIHGEHDPILVKKLGYLNKPFFMVRIVFYFMIWILINRFFFKNSTSQDVSGDKALTMKMEKYSSICMLLFGITLSFASFDLLMTLDPHWYSTIFGVYYFAGSAVGALAALGLLAAILKTYGYLKMINEEHHHDIGKLLFGFSIFWAYIAFSQFFLIWYGNIPEETTWYLDRQNGSWLPYSIFLVIGHVAVPLFYLLSRHVKRNIKAAVVMYVWMLFMHLVDLYWIVKPTMLRESEHPEFHLTLTDMAVFLGMALVFCGFMFHRMKKHSLLAHNDPRLAESIHFHNG